MTVISILNPRLMHCYDQSVQIYVVANDVYLNRSSLFVNQTHMFSLNNGILFTNWLFDIHENLIYFAFSFALNNKQTKAVYHQALNHSGRCFIFIVSHLCILLDLEEGLSRGGLKGYSFN